MGDTDVKADGVLQRGLPRRDVLRGSTAAAVGISAMMLPSAAQAFSLTVNGSPVEGVTVYWSERGTPGGSNGRIGRLTYGGDTTVANVDNAWVSGIEAPNYLMTDGTLLYHSTSTAGASQGIWRVDIGGTRTLIVPGVVATRVHVDDTDLYYAAGGSIFRIAKDGSGSATTLYDGGGDIRDIAVAGDTLYFASWANSEPGQVLTIPKAGAGGDAPTVFATLSFPNVVEISGGVVYVGTSPDYVLHRYRVDGTSLGSFGTYGFVDGIQVIDGVLFVGTSNSTGITASGLDGVNSDLFVYQGQSPQTVVGTNLGGIAILP